MKLIPINLKKLTGFTKFINFIKEKFKTFLNNILTFLKNILTFWPTVKFWLKKLIVFLIEIIVIIVIGIVILIGLSFSFVKIDEGHIYHYQNWLTNETHIYTGPEIYFHYSNLISKVSVYNKTISISFSSFDTQKGSVKKEKSKKQKVIKVRWEDNYMGYIPVNFQFKLPENEEKIKKIHDRFHEEESLIKFLTYISREAVIQTALLHSSEEIFENRLLQEFKAHVRNQLEEGFYKITRKKEVERNIFSFCSEAKEIWKSIKEEERLQEYIPLNKYGIKIGFIILDTPKPGKKLKQKLAAIMDEKVAIQKQKMLKTEIESQKTIDKLKFEETRFQKELQEELIRREQEINKLKAKKELNDAKHELELIKIETEKKMLEAEENRKLELLEKEKEFQKAELESNTEWEKLQAAQRKRDRFSIEGNGQ